MVWWKRKSDGFVWREHVRTTILVRRDQRRQQIDDLRVAAVDGVKDAGRKGAKLGAAGARSAASGIWRAITFTILGAFDVVLAVSSATSLWLWHTAGPALSALAAALTGALGRFVRPIIGPAIAALRQPLASLVLVLAGAAATASATVRYYQSGIDGQAMPAIAAAALAGVLLLIAQWPKLLAVTGLDRINLSDRARRAAMTGVVILTAAGLVGATIVVGNVSGVWRSMSNGATAVVSGGSGLIAGSSTIEGRTVAVSAVRLKVAGTDVQLYGVEAPEPNQTCGSRRCPVVAKTALQKLVQGKRATCSMSGQTDDGLPSATCKVDGVDLAAQLVRAGHVFATTGLFAAYSGQEREARNDRVGLWRVNAERPSDYRAKVWDDAKKSAPDGCPIKGVIAGDAKTYVAPWSANYDKAKVRTSRGERWFCSEAEARNAGWKPSDAL